MKVQFVDQWYHHSKLTRMPSKLTYKKAKTVKGINKINFLLKNFATNFIPILLTFYSLQLIFKFLSIYQLPLQRL